MGTHPIFESDFDCLTGKCGLSVRIKMSDTEGAAPAPVAAPAAGQYSVETAVQETLKHAQHRDGLSRGLNEAVRALERKDALCYLGRKLRRGKLRQTHRGPLRRTPNPNSQDW